MAAAPTLINYQQSSWSDLTTTAAEVTPSITWLTGDVIVVVASTADGNFTLATPVASGLSFTLIAGPLGTAGTNATVYAWKATAASGSSATISCTPSGSTASTGRGCAVFQYRGSDGVGNSGTMTGSALKVVSLIRGTDNSAVISVMADWNAVTDVTVDPSPAGGTQRVAAVVSGQATFFLFDWGDQGAAATTSYGITTHTGTVKMTGIAVEIKGTTAAGFVAQRPRVSEQAVNRATTY